MSSTWVESEQVKALGESSRLGPLVASDLGLVGTHQRAPADDVLAADDEPLDPVWPREDEPGDEILGASELEPVNGRPVGL